ncbi:hypothetical protein D3C87_266260 [compost metagenome]
MKKLLLFVLLLITSIAGKAQFTTGWDKAINFGGAGADVEELRYVGTDLYFFARMMGKYQFAGTTYDAGAIGSYPDQDLLFGKISASGTQTLLRRFESVELSAITGGARIGTDGSLYVLRLGLGTAQTIGSITTPTYGVQLLKIDASGQPSAVKKLNTFSDIEFGTTGVASPNLYAMQVKDNGDIYAILKSNTARGSVYAARVLKLDNAGNEIWHYEMTANSAGTSMAGIIADGMPRQFVDDAGNLTFKVGSSSDMLFNGETLPYEEPYTYAGQSTLRNWIISLNSSGVKKWNTSAYVSPTFYGVNPQSGEIYINYQYSRQSPAVPASIAPFSSLPNLAPPPPFSYIQPVYSWSGIITLNTSGAMVKTKSNYANAIAYPTQMQMTANGRIVLFSAATNGNVFKAGENFISFDGPGYAAMEVDADFNPLKVFRLPSGSAMALNNNKFAFGGPFKSTTTVGSTTLTPYHIDTDFNTRFPAWGSIKTDVLIAEGNLDNISTELVSSTWLGTSTNWNDAANWSNGVPTNETKVIFNATTTNMPSVATTPKAAVVVINAGVTASLPSALVVTEKIVNNGILSVNNASSFYSFTAYSAKSIEGTGELFFNGTAAGAVTYATLLTPTTNTLSLNHNVQISGVVKDIKFLGTAAILTGTLEITNPATDAITGFSATSHIRGSLTRAINATGIYVFPTDNYGPYEPTTLNLNNLTGTTKITVANDYSAGAPNLTLAGGTTTKVLGDYYWKITPDVSPTGGTYEVSFTKSSFTNGVTDADRYVVLKRPAVGTPWTFEGVKVASTQTGGTTSGQTVSNATVTAGLTGLTKFSDFVIGINTTPVPTGTTVTTSTWTGAANTQWADVGNWSDGVPTGLTAAIIPAGLTNYPLVYTATDNAKSLTINTGVVGLKLHAGLILSSGLINNSSIEIARLIGSDTKFSGYGGGISGSGKIRFETTGGLINATANNVANDVEINIGNTNSFTLLGKYSGNINIVSGLINALKFGSDYLEQTNASATIQVAAPINSIAAERLFKAVNTTGTYVFPIGDFQHARNGVRKLGEISITNNNIGAATTYGVAFDSYGTAPVSFTSGTDLFSSFINSGQWSIVPSAFSTTGTVDITFKTSNYTNGRVNTGDYVLLRRAEITTGTTVPWVIVSGASISENAGTITVSATGLAPFSTNTMFCIGIKATTTTWTGATSNDWNTASNWSNGVPSATVKAIIANATKYPTNAPTSGSAAAAIEIASGATLNLPSGFYTPNGIINNGIINISGSGTFFGFGSGTSFSTLSGTGKLVFGNSSPAIFDSYYMNNIVNNAIEINKTGGISLVRNTNVTGNITLTNGTVTVPSGQVLNMTNPNATITSTATSYIIGDLKRSINATGSYNFPVGTASAYAPATLQLNNITGTTAISSNFVAEAISGQPNLTVGGGTVNSLLGTGSWKINATPTLTGGSYDISLSAPIGSSTATSFVVLKRPDNYSFYSWTNQGTNQPSTVNAGVVTAGTTGITSFSQFGLGEMPIVTLPVKLAKFVAKTESNSVLLTWETLTELNSDKFVVERSTDGMLFLPVGDVKAKGSSTQQISYSLRDKNPQSGINYYRLKQVDLDGAIEYSSPSVIDFKFNKLELTLYPNPVSEKLYISGLNSRTGNILIYALNGQKVASLAIKSNEVTIPAGIPNNIYLLIIHINDGSRYTQKILIKR